MKTMIRLLALFLLAGCAAEPPLQAVQAPRYSARSLHAGIWVWHFEAFSTERARRRLFEFCDAEGIDLLMVQMHYRMNPFTKRLLGLKKPTAYEKLLAEAARRDIRVEALDGERWWALPEHQGRFWPKLEAILDWNGTHPPAQQFAGLHLDVEPYLLDDFRTERRWELLRDYLRFHEEARDIVKQRDPRMTFAADIPFWYDVHEESEYSDHCVVEFNGKKAYASSHMQDICDYIGIMSYRRTALGPNGVFELCRGELEYAEKIGKRIYAGLETGPPQDDPPHISFYGTDVPWFRKQTALVEEAFRGRPGYGGLLIHHYLSYRKFLETPAKPYDPESPAA